MSKASSLLAFGASLLFAGACEKNRSASPDPCGDGGCGDVPQCELGVCDGFSAPTSRDHSPLAGTFAEGDASCPFGPDELPNKDKLISDSKKVPEFNGKRARGTNYTSGEDELQDTDLHEHLLGVQGRIFECIDLAACYQEEKKDAEFVGAGELDFQFELEPSGRVAAVSVTPTGDLGEPIVLACARKSLYEFRFPSYSGARMVVSYRVEIGDSV
jgi:hypothetical protein